MHATHPPHSPGPVSFDRRPASGCTARAAGCDTCGRCASMRDIDPLAPYRRPPLTDVKSPGARED